MCIYKCACTHACAHTHTCTHYMVQYKRMKSDENINFVLNWKWNMREYLDLPMFMFIGCIYSLYVGSCILLHWTYCQRKWQQCETNSIRPPDCTKRASHTWTSPPGPCYGYTTSPGQSWPWSSEENFELGWVYNVYIQDVPGGMCETSGECSLC